MRAVAALQAQDAGAAALGVRARRPGSTLAEVEAARFEERSVARTWVMRGTLHLIPAEDARWMVALLGPIGLRKSARRIAELGRRHRGGRRRRARRARRRPAHPPRARRRGARVGVKLPDHPQVPAWLTGVRRAAGRDHRGAGGPVRALRRLARPPAPATVGPGRRAGPPPRARASARRRPRTSRSGRGCGMREARRAYGELRARGGRGARPHGRGSRAGSSRRRRTCGCCRGSTAGCSATATASLIMRAGARQGGHAGRRDPGRHAGRGRPH